MIRCHRYRALGIAAALLLFAACADRGTPEGDGALPGAARLAGMLGAEDTDYARVTEPRPFVFPQDHGPHPEFRNEWWYLTGNLWADDGARYGYELTIFRFSLSPEPTGGPSAWRSNQLYIGHLAVSDGTSDTIRVAERLSRGALGLAGSRAEPFEVWLEDWRIRGTDTDGAHGLPWEVAASAGEFGVSLSLHAGKQPVPQGERGLSQKSAEPGNASYYYSMTRLPTRGELEIEGRRIAVEGSSWLDREWSSSALAADQEGWDWFALQFDDGTELMYYQLRQTDGSAGPMSAGTLISQSGEVVPLTAGEVELEVLDSWESPRGGRYPARWRLAVPGEGLIVTIEPVFADQELDTLVRYWEGAVDVRGRRGEATVTGHGYVELTGYADEAAPNGNSG